MSVTVLVLTGPWTSLTGRETLSWDQGLLEIAPANMQGPPQGLGTANQGHTGAQPTVIQTPNYRQKASSCGRVIEHILGKAILTLGVMQVIIGVLCIIFNIAGIAMHSVMAFAGHGIWCGIFFILTGVFAILAGLKKQYGLVVTCMILTIIAAVLSLPLLSLASVGWSQEEWNHYYDIEPDPSCCYYYGYNTDHTIQTCCDSYDYRNLHARNAMHGLLVFLAVTNAILAIITSSFSCHAICCGPRQARLNNNAVRYIQAGQGVQLIIIQGQDGSQQAVPINTQGYAYNPQLGNPQMAPILFQGGQPQQQLQQQLVQPLAPPSYNSHQPAAMDAQQQPDAHYQPLVAPAQEYGVKT